MSVQRGQLHIESWSGNFIQTETKFEGEGIAFECGDILFGKLRPYLAKVYLADTAGEAVGDFHVMRPTKSIDSRFSQYQILNREFIAIIDGSTFGAKMPRVSWDFLGNMVLTMPSIPEQQTITTFLDCETAKIDALIAEQQRLIELLKEKRQSVISHAVTKGLNPNAPMKDSGVKWLGDVPEHWKTVSLRWVSKRYSGGTPDKLNLDYWTNGTIPWLNSGAVNEPIITEPSAYISEEALLKSSAKWVPKGALVMALAGQGKTKGMVAQLAIKTTCNQSMAAIITTEEIEARFLYWWLVTNYQNIRNMAGGDLRDGLNLELLGNIPCPLLPYQEQQTIVAFLDRETAKLDTLTTEAKTAITLLQERRTALISAAVTGKIDVRGLASAKTEEKAGSVPC